MTRDPFQRLPRPGWRGVLLAVACIAVGMLIQMLTGGDVIGGSVAAVFCVGAVMFLLSPKPSILDVPPTRAKILFLAWLFTGLAIVAGVAAVFIPWQQGADFDILGIMFLLTNLIPLGVVLAALFFGALAVSHWLRVLAR
jgi:hypothetical protein